MYSLLTFTASLFTCMASCTCDELESVSQFAGRFLQGPDLDLHLHRGVQCRPFPLQGHFGALWHVDLHWQNY